MSSPSLKYPERSKPDLIKIVFLTLCAGVFLWIPLKVSSYGYFPPDDALRHVAHAVDGRPWGEVLVLRADLRVEVDSHPGWHKFLAAAHQRLGISADGLITLSYMATFISFGWAGLIASRSPFAWMAGVGLLAVVETSFFMRLLFGRPFAITAVALVILLFDWMRECTRPWWNILLGHAIVLSVAIWAHPSAWYVWGGVLFCLGVAGQWRRLWISTLALALALAVVTAITGSFYNTVSYPVVHLWHALATDSGRILNLVTEFQPSGGPFVPIAIVGSILCLRHYPTRGTELRAALLRVDFLVFVVMWVLGLKITRFWADWGVPAFVVWLVGQFKSFPVSVISKPLERLAITAVLCATVYLNVAIDTHGRYTEGLGSVLLTKTDEEIKTVLPDDGGIMYNTDMQLFYRLYYRFPHAKVRYVLGFEPGMMPDDDLATYRAIQTSGGEIASYKPWFDKMKPADRVLFYGAAKPEWPGIEFEKVYSAWLGRLARTPLPAAPSSTTSTAPATTVPPGPAK